jgi:NAD(P)-dependent dehydrogenase (short-subunit alcohol dehydrogenase family)
MPTVLLTGTSTGFGHVTTELLATRDWRVFAIMRDLARKDPLERTLRDAGLSERLTFVQLDVTDPASIEAAVATVLSETGNTLDAVVHNAGIAVAGVLEDVPDVDFRRVMDTNFFGVLKLARALLPIFRAQGRGRIVLLSSQAADRHQAQTSRDPQEVALVVAKALEAKRPRFRYQVGFFAELDYLLRGKMPTRLIRRGTTRYLGLPLARW